MQSMWKECEARVLAAHPLVPLINPLRAIYYMVIITYLPHFLRIPLVFTAQGYYDNLHARKQTDGRLDKKPLGRAVFRATSAHANSFEALLCFTAACFTAHLAGLEQGVAAPLCSLFLACRLVYVFLYIAGAHWTIGVARSLVWVAGFAATLRLQLLALAKLGL